MAAKRRPIIPQQTLRLNMSEAVRERQRERCEKQQVVGGGVGYGYILYKYFITTLLLKKSHQKSWLKYTHATNGPFSFCEIHFTSCFLTMTCVSICH